MVRASVTFNNGTKTYDWKVTNNDHPIVFEITTPNHNLCLIRNYVYERTQRSENFLMFGEYVQLQQKDISKLFQEFPLSRSFWLAITDLDQARMFHPVQNKFIDNINDEFDNLVLLAASIHVDILLHVLEFDRQCKRDILFEHQFMKTQFEADMKSIVQSVQTQQPTQPTHDCTLASKGYCRGWQEGMYIHSCPDLSSLAR